jgi:hypothetical protein
MNVSLCLIVRNEASRLPHVLTRFGPLVRELVVVDTGSSDDTREVAQRHGGKVFDFPWIDDFAAARNESIRRATCPWILWADADDGIDDANLERLRGFLPQLTSDNVGYTMRCASVTPDGELQSSHPQVRLFPNDARLRWERRVHEQIIPSIERHGGSVRETGIVLRHFGYASKEVILAKAERNLRLCELECQGAPLDAYAQFCRGAALVDLGRHAEALIALNLAAGGLLPDLAARKLYADMARCYVREGGLSLAVEALETGRSYYPDDPGLLFAQAQLLGAQGDYATAEACMRRIFEVRVDESADCPDAGVAGPRGRYLLALLCALQNKNQSAEFEAHLAVAADPKHAPTWLVLADALAGQGALDGIERLLSDPALPASACVALRMYLRVTRRDFAGAREELEAVGGGGLEGVPRAEQWLRDASSGTDPRPIGFLVKGRPSATSFGT